VTNATDFHDNLSSDNGDDGVETDGKCANVRLWGNVMHDTLSGASVDIAGLRGNSRHPSLTVPRSISYRSRLLS